MNYQYHILNGDSLKAQFPVQIAGKIIVARECLVDGDVRGENLSEFYKVRSRYLASNYDGIEEADYYQKSMSEFLKIQDIPKDSEVFLWFEWDLFCQVNFWFVMHLLLAHSKFYKTLSVYFVQPKPESIYSFGRMTGNELKSAFERKSIITEASARQFSQLWLAYQKKDHRQMLRIGHGLKKSYPYILAAIHAHLDRIPTDSNLGRDARALIEIIHDLGTEEFEPIFKEFCLRESIYGYGDVQVRRLWMHLRKDEQ